MIGKTMMMSELEQAVIKAARELAHDPNGLGRMFTLQKAVLALDDPMVTDPWKLVEQASAMFAQGFSSETGYQMSKKIERALEWRRTHEE